MKKLIATVLAFSALNLVQAQQAATSAHTQQQPVQANKPTPAQIAERQSRHMQKNLDLTDDQKQKAYQAILTRVTNIEQIRAKYGSNGDKKSMRAEMKPVHEQFMQTMNGILTPDQKTKWNEQREKEKGAHKKHQQQQGNAAGQKEDGTED